MSAGEPATEVVDEQPVDAPAVAEPANTFADGFGCNTVAQLTAPLSAGMYPSESNVETATEIGCYFGSKPGITIIDGSELDLLVHIINHENQTKEKSEQYCQSARSGPSALDAIGGCDTSALGGPHEVQATIPFFDVSIAYSCEMSTTCTPALPVDKTVMLGVLEQLGLTLTNG